MNIYHDSQNSLFRFPFGSVSAGESVVLRIKAPECKKAVLRTWFINSSSVIPMEKDASGVFSCIFKTPEEAGVLWYYFILDEDIYYGNNRNLLGGTGEIYSHEPPSFQITLYDKAFTAPKLTNNAVMLQIFPDRYNKSPNYIAPEMKGRVIHNNMYEPPYCVLNCFDGDNIANDFFMGNLKGIEEKLFYIQSLGVNLIYLNPVFLSRSNHRYNTSNYMQIDPYLGDNNSLKSLCKAADKMGINVILDGVFSHTGSDSIYFNKEKSFNSVGAYNSKESPYYSWFNFENWPNKYDCWWGFETLPNVNELDPNYMRFIMGDSGVIDTWLKSGTSGWRLDVADELPMEFIKKFRAKLKSVSPNSLLLGEVWEDPTNKTAYGENRCYALGDTLDGTMNYPLRDAVIDFFLNRAGAYETAAKIMFIYETQPKAFYQSSMNLLGSHDKPRIISILSDSGNMEPCREERKPITLSPEQYALGKERFIKATRLISLLPGIPSLYYGDEAGMTGMADPYNRGMYPWGKEDIGLVNEISDILNYRKNNGFLATEGVYVNALNNDTLLVKRGEKEYTVAR